MPRLKQRRWNQTLNRGTIDPSVEVRRSCPCNYGTREAGRTCTCTSGRVSSSDLHHRFKICPNANCQGEGFEQAFSNPQKIFSRGTSDQSRVPLLYPFELRLPF